MTTTDVRPTNRLIDETSPYLQQHAFNPVDWYAWGDEALQKSRELDRPIFLSIGYSACHWCHVMEHESFENPEIAKLMNAYFVCIKVDREERPDLDQIYMTAVQLMSGHGGWPMSVFLTPTLKPFFGGTYWPPEPRMRMPGFAQILNGVHDAWMNRRTECESSSQQLAEAIAQVGGVQDEQTELDDTILQAAERSLLRSADRAQGGFGGAPKFPHPMDLRLLLRTWKRFGNQDALDVTTLTLNKMAHGGIYDHLGGGFHRYATDAQWLVPHFEKMLYDNALLTSVYVEAYQATGTADYARVVRETLDYVLREMTQPQGGFYSTQDADSEGVEGKFFVWTEDEVIEVLGPEDARVFCYCYDVTPRGNWEGHNILNRPKTHDQAARMLGLSPDDLETVLARCRAKLFDVRSRRVAPGRDEKVLVSWNGLMIAAMSQAAMALNESTYAEAATRAADFILQDMREADGRLLHSYKDGRARFNAYLDDYACLIDGLIDVYQATAEPRYLEAALALAERMREQFLDSSTGGFFYTSNDHEALVARIKDSQDNATPSGNGMAAYALLRLGRLTSKPDIEETSLQTLRLLSGQLRRVTMASGQALLALDFLLGPAYEFVFAGGSNTEANAAGLAEFHKRFVPNKVVARLATASGPEKALTSGKTALDGQPTLYPCEHGSCQRPLAGVSAISDWLDGKFR